MAKRSITLEEQLKESDWELQRTHCEMQVASGAVLVAQRLDLSKLEEVRSRRQQLKDENYQLSLASEKVTSAEATSAEAAV